MRRWLIAVGMVGAVLVAVAPSSVVADNAIVPPEPGISLPAPPWSGFGVQFSSVAATDIRVTLVGASFPAGSNRDGLWVRALRSGVPDASFGTNGTVEWPPAGRLDTLHLDVSGAAYAIFHPNDPGPMSIAALYPDGTPWYLVAIDRDAGATGPPTILMTDQGVLMASRGNDGVVIVERFDLDGSRDGTFGTASLPVVVDTTDWLHLAQRPGGGVSVVVGRPSGFGNIAIHLDSVGSVLEGPHSFDTPVPGSGVGEQVTKIMVVGDRLLVAGWHNLYAFGLDGTVDTGYGDNGVAAAPNVRLYRFHFSADGAALAIESPLPQEGWSSLEVGWITPDGSPAAVGHFTQPIQIFHVAFDSFGAWLAPNSVDHNLSGHSATVNYLQIDGMVLNPGFPPATIMPVVGSNAHLTGVVAQAAWALVLLGGLLLAFGRRLAAGHRP